MTDTTPEEVTLKVDGRAITGWQNVSLTRGCERIPNSFSIGLTALNPSDGSKVVAFAGQACELALGSDVVITGYIDRDTNGGDANGHQLSITGRGKCQDLVDCSAQWPSGQLVNGNVLQVASQLACYYNIGVSALNGVDVGPQIPQFQLELRATPACSSTRTKRATSSLPRQARKSTRAARNTAMAGTSFGGSSSGRWTSGSAKWSVHC